MNEMGLIANIYRAKGLEHCSNDGISESFDEVTLVNVSGPFEPTDIRPAALLREGPLGTVNVVPAELVNGEYAVVRNGVGPMMGGAYVGTSDSRFGDAVRALLGHGFYGAVALHDRFETAKQYATHD